MKGILIVAFDTPDAAIGFPCAVLLSTAGRQAETTDKGQGTASRANYALSLKANDTPKMPRAPNEFRTVSAAKHTSKTAMGVATNTLMCAQLCLNDESGTEQGTTEGRVEVFHNNINALIAFRQQPA